MQEIHRATVSQAHLDKSAAAIRKLTRRKPRAPRGEKLDDIQRYAFVEMDGHLFALRARRGSRIGIVCGGITYPIRVPKTRAEKAAVLREGTIPTADAAIPLTDTVALMARKILEAAPRGGIERQDFHQAGIADELITPNFDAAMKLARKVEPRLDDMVATP